MPNDQYFQGHTAQSIALERIAAVSWADLIYNHPEVHPETHVKIAATVCWQVDFVLKNYGLLLCDRTARNILVSNYEDGSNPEVFQVDLQTVYDDRGLRADYKKGRWLRMPFEMPIDTQLTLVGLSLCSAFKACKEWKRLEGAQLATANKLERYMIQHNFKSFESLRRYLIEEIDPAFKKENRFWQLGV